jgi:serine/threonine-protein kinase HipA
VLSGWPVIGHGKNELPLEKAKLAMAIRGRRPHYRLDEITGRHFRDLAGQAGIPDLWNRMQAFVGAAPDALARLDAGLPKGFPERVFSRIRTGVLGQCRRFGET